ncbi:MAG: hypothetical protein QS721_01405 [Candidatus Endonucleobacter sp. (ex Gigantidas childressi)]|nr:hypothetical protein [Candidatus Endonucleobacter sp. (ex Gigantidas childressi)]
MVVFRTAEIYCKSRQEIDKISMGSLEEITEAEKWKAVVEIVNTPNIEIGKYYNMPVTIEGERN